MSIYYHRCRKSAMGWGIKIRIWRIRMSLRLHLPIGHMRLKRIMRHHIRLRKDNRVMQGNTKILRKSSKTMAEFISMSQKQNKMTTMKLICMIMNFRMQNHWKSCKEIVSTQFKNLKTWNEFAKMLFIQLLMCQRKKECMTKVCSNQRISEAQTNTVSSAVKESAWGDPCKMKKTMLIQLRF